MLLILSGAQRSRRTHDQIPALRRIDSPAWKGIDDASMAFVLAVRAARGDGRVRRRRADQDRRRRRRRLRAGLCGAGARLFRRGGRAGGAGLFRCRRAGGGGDGLGRGRCRRRRGDGGVLQPRRPGRAQDHRRRRARRAGISASGDRRLAQSRRCRHEKPQGSRRPFVRADHQGGAADLCRWRASRREIRVRLQDDFARAAPNHPQHQYRAGRRPRRISRRSRSPPGWRR